MLIEEIKFRQTVRREEQHTDGRELKQEGVEDARKTAVRGLRALRVTLLTQENCTWQEVHRGGYWIPTRCSATQRTRAYDAGDGASRDEGGKRLRSLARSLANPYPHQREEPPKGDVPARR